MRSVPENTHVQLQSKEINVRNVDTVGTQGDLMLSIISTKVHPIFARCEKCRRINPWNIPPDKYECNHNRIRDDDVLGVGHDWR